MTDFMDMLRVKEQPVFEFKKFKHELLDFIEMEAETTEHGRRYTTPEGNIYPSMTTVLGQLDNPGALNAWRKRIGYAEAKRQTQEAVDRGNVLHDLSERYLLNTLNESDITLDQGGLMFKRAQEFLNQIDIIHGVEVPMYSDKMKFAGRADLIATIGGDLCIADHKNSKKLLKGAKLGYLKEKLYKYQLQAYGYKVALEEMKGLVATHGVLFVSKPKLDYDDEYVSEMIKWEFTPSFNEMFEFLMDSYYK